MLKYQENAFSIFSTLLYVLLRLTIAAATASPLSATALFVFGDSTVDPGNNIHIPTAIRADHPPYGRNLSDHKPLGRFTNGKLVTDFLSSLLGLKELLPPYLDPTLSDDELISGASFASAGMGLDEMTCRRLKVMNISTQLGYFDKAVSRIAKKLRSREATRVVEDAIYLVSAGSNDLLINMYDLPTRRAEYSVSQYEDILLQKVQSTIERLSNAGARKIAIAGLPPLGCTPLQVTLSIRIPRSCVDSQNRDAREYNSKLRNLLSAMSSKSTKGIELAYLDIYAPIMDMINRPKIYGLKRTLEGCCGTGLLEVACTCNTLSLTCRNASQYLFFDAIHPTEAVYERMSQNIYNTMVKKFT